MVIESRIIPTVAGLRREKACEEDIETNARRVLRYEEGRERPRESL